MNPFTFTQSKDLDGVLAPYVGLTMETTTSIIGAVLAGIALGAAVGGIFADRTDPRRLAVGLAASA